MTKIICQIQYTKKNRSKKSGNKDEKALYKLTNSAVHGKTMENLRNIIEVRLVNNVNISKILFDNDLVVIRKSKVTLTLNKPVYVGKCISDLSKAFMYEFHWDYIKSKYSNNSRLLFTDNDSLMYEH